MKTTNIKLTNEEVLCLLNALEDASIHRLDDNEMATHRRMLKRVERAFDLVCD